MSSFVYRVVDGMFIMGASSFLCIINSYNTLIELVKGIVKVLYFILVHILAYLKKLISNALPF